MSELLYNKSEAVAALNHVEGFNPKELARRIEKEGQEDQLYLDVKYRKLWFRLVHPTGKIISHIVHFNEQMAVIEARIYLDKMDAPESYIANAFSQKFRSPDPQFGDKFLETAETAAIGRALADAGFGVQFADVGEEADPVQVDAGIPVSNQNGMMNQNKMSSAQETPISQTAQQFQNNAAMPNSQQSMMNNFYQEAQQQRNVQLPMGNIPQGMTPQNPGMAQGINPMQAATQPLEASLPVEELVRRMTYEQATQIVIGGKGKFGNKTMGQVAVESPSSLDWFVTSYKGNNNLVPAAAKFLLERAMPMAG